VIDHAVWECANPARIQALISLAEARAKILAHIPVPDVECIPLAQARDRVFARPITCPTDVPAFDNSQVDGYALRSADEGIRRIVGESAAGGPPPPPLAAGQAIRIFTGAPIPDGADAVIMQEDAAVEADGVAPTEPVHPGQFIRFRGEEIEAGTDFDVTGLPATPPLVGLAASFGLTEIPVFQRPRVAILATGSELIRLGEPIGAGQTYASNLESLHAAFEALGLAAQTLLVGDDRQATREALAAALDEADVLVTTGGVSVGDHDHIRPALGDLGVEELFWRVDIKPGKPFFCGTLGSKLIFGLPGNPVSALVTYHVLVRPALRRLLGLRTAEEDQTARLAHAIQRTDLRYEFLRATLCEGVVTAVAKQGSHMQTGLAFADALLHLPRGEATFVEGQPVTVTPIRWSAE